MPLTHIAVAQAKPKDKPYKLTDGEGMFLYVSSAGGKIWRMKYRFHDKEKLLTFGSFPEISLNEAREKRYQARKLLADGVDPCAQKKADKAEAVAKTENTFEHLARQWHHANQSKWKGAHGNKILRRLEQNIFPVLGNRPIAEIKRQELLGAIREIEKRGATELSHRVLQNCTAIFQYALLLEKVEHNIGQDLKGALKSHKAKHYPTIDVRELPSFLQAIEQVSTSQMNKLAIRLLLYTFVRQGEMRQAEWQHIDYKAKEWRIPAGHTKMGEMHIVPLARQTLALLEELKPLCGNSSYLFPSQNRQKNPYMSENTINMVIKKMGYGGKLVGHGFRALASTTLNEVGHFMPDVIERQLAHMERDGVRAAYNRAQYMSQRKQMMQWWADYIDSLMN